MAQVGGIESWCSDWHGGLHLAPHCFLGHSSTVPALCHGSQDLAISKQTLLCRERHHTSLNLYLTGVTQHSPVCALGVQVHPNHTIEEPLPAGFTWRQPSLSVDSAAVCPVVQRRSGTNIPLPHQQPQELCALDGGCSMCLISYRQKLMFYASQHL